MTNVAKYFIIILCFYFFSFLYFLLIVRGRVDSRPTIERGDFMRNFVESALIRAVRTVCQTAVATIGTATVLGSVDWKVVISTSMLSGILSVLTSVATGLPEAETEEK